MKSHVQLKYFQDGKNASKLQPTDRIIRELVQKTSQCYEKLFDLGLSNNFLYFNGHRINAIVWSRHGATVLFSELKKKGY